MGQKGTSRTIITAATNPSYGTTALMLPLRDMPPEVVQKLLIAAGANVNARNKAGDTPLVMAATGARGTEAVQAC